MSSHRTNLAPPFMRFRNFALEFIQRPFCRLSPRARFIIGFSLLVLVTTLIIVNPYTRFNGETYKEGDIVRQTVISPADILENDIAETNRWRQAARDAVRPIFTIDSNLSEQSQRSFRNAFEELQKPFDKNKNSQSNINQDYFYAPRKFTPNETERITDVLRETTSGYIYNDGDAEFTNAEITLVERQKPNQQTALLSPRTNMTAVSVARQKLNSSVEELNGFTSSEKAFLLKMLSPLVQANVIYDNAATGNAREIAAASIPEVTVSLKRNQVVAREGDTVTATMLAQFAAIRSYSQSARQFNKFFGLLFLMTALFWIAKKFIEHRSTIQHLILSPRRTFALFALAVLTQTVLMAIGFRLAEFTAAQNVRAPFNDVTAWAMIIPFASATLLIVLLIDAQIALLVSVFTALIAGLIAPKGLEFAMYAAISSAIAVYGIERYQTRQAVTFAALIIGTVNAATGIALIGYMQQPFVINAVLLAIGGGLLGGFVTAAVTAVLLPIFESLFGILTDIKLLELSNADLPILGRLALRAPGTNQHSHAVGQLSEDAARAIGANPLLARIGSLYHDIGKVAAPDYFVENQLGTNPHDKLQPIQSAKIITSHVTYGLKLGQEIGLPERILDFIAQHHGTRTLHYFLKKAQSTAVETGETVNEDDYRYPGPKPQFKEVAIMMIADSCEAAARTLDHPTTENIRYIVNKIIDAIVADFQLDECDLTLRQLTQIRESMIHSLSAIHHSRIEYPGFTLPSTNGFAAKNGKSNGIGIHQIEAVHDSTERGFLLDPKDVSIAENEEDVEISLKNK
ncbi:MAG: HDIG domain-containing protein [Pyrinomonadaceae bacterium]|nr:HDIG domain-containing protein [Pyrinomonadaceae bacterium]